MIEPRVYMRHVRQVSTSQRMTCAAGIRAWCEANNIDLREFLRDGMPGEQAAAIGGHFGMTALDNARKEAASGR